MSDTLQQSETVLGIELGSTRIKAVLIDRDHRPVVSGEYAWENRLENGVWTYHLEDVWTGLQACYGRLAANFRAAFGRELTRPGAIGISAMMHGFLIFDGEGRLLTPFRTWRNTMTARAAEALTAEFGFNIPERWSVAHLYQSVLDGAAFVPDIRFMTTLSGYVHFRLTGRRVLGIGDASGMFPIDSAARDFDRRLLDRFDGLTAGYPWRLGDILPRVLTAGEDAGVLTEEGARLLDPSGALEAGIPLCPPEGDAGTGMAATNSVLPRTGNVSAGTSVFAMVVLEKPLSRVYPQIDLVTTPAGDPVAMSHANNCTSDINAWVSLFGEAAAALGAKADPGELFSVLFGAALQGDADCGGLLTYGYLSGEGITGLEEGRPLFVRTADSRFNLANFMRAQLLSALCALRIGMDILTGPEGISVELLMGHGGFFKTPGVGQELMAAAMEAPVSCLETAGEGGPWGIALLASYRLRRAAGESLGEYLDRRVFAGARGTRAEPKAEAVAGFRTFLRRYRDGLAVERAAVAALGGEESRA
jgi:sugar (pentulose or hexulose) kinase